MAGRDEHTDTRGFPSAAPLSVSSARKGAPHPTSSAPFVVNHRRRPRPHRRIVGGVLERGPRLTPYERHERQKLEQDEPRWRQCESILRSYIRNHFLPRNESQVTSNDGDDDNDPTTTPTPHEVDPHEALVYFCILVETRLLDPGDLTTVELQPFVHPYCRSDTNRISVWDRRITRLRLGYSGCASWDFHREAVWDLLARLKHLRVLHLEGCAEFRLFETTSRLPNLRGLFVECQTRHGIHCQPPHRLRDAVFADRLRNDAQLKPPPPHPLETLSLASHELHTEDDVSGLLLEVLASFPNVHTLRVKANHIDSIRTVALKIQQSDQVSTMGQTHKLQTFDLGTFVPKPERPFDARRNKAKRRRRLVDGTVMLSNDLPDEMQSMQLLFKTFPNLRTLRGMSDALMELYGAARIIAVETQPPNQPLPLSCWPIALETAWKRGFGFVAPYESFRAHRTRPSPDGIYRLLPHVLSEKEKHRPPSQPSATIEFAETIQDEPPDAYVHRLLASLDKGFDD